MELATSSSFKPSTGPYIVPFLTISLTHNQVPQVPVILPSHQHQALPNGFFTLNFPTRKVYFVRLRATFTVHIILVLSESIVLYEGHHL